jgi:hypothetical protein
MCERRCCYHLWDLRVLKATSWLISSISRVIAKRRHTGLELSVPHVLLSSLLDSRSWTGAPSRARCSLNGKPVRFLAEDLRHTLAGLRRLTPASSHVNVNMAEEISFDDFTLFDTSESEGDDDMAPSVPMGIFPFRTLTNNQPDYSNNNNNTTSARRSRSPTRDRDNNNYRDQRSPANNYERTDRRPSRSEQPQGNMEDRQNSQQDRRVYVGNLSYDVKWHHLKDHMREGTFNSPAHHSASLRDIDDPHSRSGSLRRRPRAPERNEQG